jgi:hypothetical protein
MSAATRCPHCGSDRLVTTLVVAGPHFARTGCAECGRFVRFDPATRTHQRAMSFVMPFGHYRGHSLARLTRTEAGRTYLAWVASSVAGDAGEAARVVLGIDPIPATAD